MRISRASGCDDGAHRHSPAVFRTCRNAGNSVLTAEGTTSRGTGSISCEVEFCIFYRLSLRTLRAKDVIHTGTMGLISKVCGLSLQTVFRNRRSKGVFYWRLGSERMLYTEIKLTNTANSTVQSNKVCRHVCSQETMMLILSTATPFSRFF
jgi:hypothetical protein